jgi:hypothetical protein
MARPNDSAAIAGHIQGLREAKGAFQALPEIVRHQTLGVNETTAREIARGAQARLRSSPSIQSRTLHDHVAWTINKSTGRARVGIKAGTTTIQVGTRKIRVKGIITAGRGGSASTSAGAKRVNPTRYGPKVEFGTRHMKAEPFMLPSAEAEQPFHAQRMRATGPAIERDVARIGGGRL